MDTNYSNSRHLSNFFLVLTKWADNHEGHTLLIYVYLILPVFAMSAMGPGGVTLIGFIGLFLVITLVLMFVVYVKYHFKFKNYERFLKDQIWYLQCYNWKLTIPDRIVITKKLDNPTSRFYIRFESDIEVTNETIVISANIDENPSLISNWVVGLNTANSSLDNLEFTIENVDIGDINRALLCAEKFIINRIFYKEMKIEDVLKLLKERP